MTSTTHSGDYSGGTLSAKDKPLDDLVKVSVSSQHPAVIFTSQFRSLTFLFCENVS